LKNVSIGLGYVPDIQFAPFYVAQSKGYYKAAGLNVTFHHGVVPDLIGSLVAGRSDFVFAGGDELLEAHDKTHVKAVDVATIFQKYPVSVIVPANSSIHTLADLKGHTVGVPGPYGSTYTGFLALLYSAHLTLQDVHVKYINFTQVPALLNHQADAVVGYSNNEPLQIAKRGMQVRTFAVSDYQPLVSNGIITTDANYQKEPQVVRSFVQATLRGLRDAINDPSGAIDASKNIPGLIDTSQTMSELQATIPVWKGNGNLGYNDAATWTATEKFLVAQKMIAPVSAADLGQMYTNKDI
jgi:NitT/TauT family transport system substrate-binding protein